jgi:hypothetical protein
VISISGIVLDRSRRGWCWPRAAIARRVHLSSDPKNQPVKMQ